MESLRRIEVDRFKIEDSVKLDELLSKKNNIITIEDYFFDKEKIILNDRKLELFLNGVRLSYNLDDELYRIYNEKNIFIGLGKVSEKLLKRDIIL